MSNWANLVEVLATEYFGPAANLRLERHGARWLAWLTRPDADGGEEVAAIAAGADTGAACRRLIEVMTRREGADLTTQEVAGVLNVDDSRVRQLTLAGSLAPSTPAAGGGIPGRYSPAGVHRYLMLPRRREQRQVLAEPAREAT